MAGQGFSILATTRINTIMRAVRDQRELPKKLRYLSRTPQVNATDGEIIAYLDGNVVAADVIADDQEATTAGGKKFTLDETAIPNIKKGQPITQAMINLMDRINQGGAIQGDEGVITNYVRTAVQDRLFGCELRLNAMLALLAIDALVYTNNGVTFTVSSGMPSDLKVTPGTLWTSTSATPITTLRTLKRLASEKYAETFDRMELSTTDFNNMVATTEFQTQAAALKWVAMPTGAWTALQQNVDLMKNLFSMMLDGMTVEIDDSQFFTEAADGTQSGTRNLPTSKVLLTSKQDDNSQSGFDVGNAVVTESVVASLPGVNLIGGGFGGPQYGPVAYATVENSLNPPQATIWGVQRAMPRRRRKTASAVLTVA
jgi:hypothetical protein